MVSFDMNNFMAEHTGDLIRTLRPFDQTGEEVDRAARDCEGIELVLFDNEESVLKGQGSGSREDASADAIDESLNFWIVGEFKLFFCLAPKLATNSRFFVFAR